MSILEKEHELIARIEELERLNDELIAEKNRQDDLDYAWTGSLGRWYWDLETNKVIANPLKIITLGYELDEVPEDIDYRFFTDRLHPDDYEKTMQTMRDHLSGKTAVYEAEYRIRTKSGEYKWYYDRGRITKRSATGKPLFLAGIVFDITERKDIEAELEQKNRYLERLSEIDSLTMLYNHRVFYEKLEMIIEAKDHTGIVVAMIDLDDFKKINDGLGHVHGDKVLKKVAEIIADNLDNEDIAARYGGEEFGIIFLKRDIMGALAACERIRTEIEKSFSVQEPPLTISCGLALASDNDAYNLIHLADLKMYEAKKLGKNRVVY